MGFCNSYADNRHRSDFDPRTVKARLEFTTKMKNTFQNLKLRSDTITDLRLKLNLRLVSQFGRGLDSALQILPVQLKYIVNIIEETIDNPEDIYNSIKNEKILSSESKEDIKLAIQTISDTEIIKISYWGYLSRSEILPSINFDSNQVTYYSHWNEGKNRYSHITKIEILSKIILGVIKKSQKRWFEIW